ncbi:4-hydroxythreonine-4-phosphate dehydrogenase PdxA [Isoptericola sp. 4D.3]|uniref:4-hydroxythreonine-4-phosphate dehydrogenase PdxA n=1 Tax=Isoptericola peretonis TaxID=2918523 RepID=A0ABT0J003_9MICO|nr:4-hydroxythreonine-4-phosphate dehydrogenase PdxA [Isoptericola sp. 4D.3]
MTTTPVTRRPRLALTLGDPSGVGPELAMRLLAVEANREQAEIHLLATQAEVDRYAAEVGVDVPTCSRPEPGKVTLVGSRLSDQAVERGVASVAGGSRALQDLRDCLALFSEGAVESIMFLPLNKSALHDAGMHEEDELRWFAKELGYDGVTSELNFVPGLTTSRVTSHCAVRDVAERISARSVLDAIRLLHEVVTANGVERPRLAVCALNPHAGENGQFGREEIDHIAPGVRLAHAEGIDAAGPYPCDTIFIAARDGDYDGVVTMYHDQGQIAMKLMGFDQGVTVQGGLPVPIATPAHGTAYGIVGQNKANLGPSQRAFDIVVALGRRTWSGGAPEPS